MISHRTNFRSRRSAFISAAVFCAASTVGVRASAQNTPKQTPPQTQKQKDLVRVDAAFSSVQKRVALVIGNKDYTDAPLKNPVNDATAMATALKSLGFTVILKTNLTNRGMSEAVSEFAELLDKNSIGLFYFSGHGVAVGGVNYLVPIGYTIKRQADVAFEAFPAQRLLDTMGGAGCTLNLVILDACRNNPLPKSIKAVGDNGLGKMDAPSGTLVAYATAPGQTASDDPDKENGLYTGVLLEKMKTPGLKIEEVFKATRISVKAASGGTQTPWEESSLENDFYFAAAIPVPTPKPEPAPNPKPAPAKPVLVTADAVFTPLVPLIALAQQAVPTINDLSDRARTLAFIASAQAGQGDTAGYEKTLQTARQTADSGTGSFGKSMALAEIVQVQVQKDIAGAKQTAQAITTPFWKTQAVLAIVLAQAQKGDVIGASDTAKTLPEAADQVRALCHIAQAQAERGDVPAARLTLQAALQKELPDVFAQSVVVYPIALAQAQIGDTQTALETVDGIAEAGEKARALCLIAHAQARQNAVEAARKTTQTAEVFIAKEVTDKIQKSVALSFLATAQARCGDTNAALKTVAAITDGRDSVFALAAIAAAYRREGNAASAEQTLGRAVKVAQALTDPPSRARSLGRIVEQFAREQRDLAPNF